MINCFVAKMLPDQASCNACAFDCYHPDNRIIAGITYTACYNNTFADINTDNGYHILIIRTQGFMPDTKQFCIGAVGLFRFSYTV